jgi:hypothetical protein
MRFINSGFRLGSYGRWRVLGPLACIVVWFTANIANPGVFHCAPTYGVAWEEGCIFVNWWRGSGFIGAISEQCHAARFRNIAESHYQGKSIRRRLGLKLPSYHYSRSADFCYCLVAVPTWIPGLFLMALLTLILWRRRTPAGHCLKCGYDLTGNVSGRCPECGSAVDGGQPPSDDQ